MSLVHSRCIAWSLALIRLGECISVIPTHKTLVYKKSRMPVKKIMVKHKTKKMSYLCLLISLGKLYNRVEIQAKGCLVNMGSKQGQLAE